MKNIATSLASIFLLLLTISCEEDDIPIKDCRNNPLENVAWIKELVSTEQNADTNNTAGLEIIQYEYQGNPAFSVNDCVNNCSDALTIIYDCKKNKICEVGGIAGVNTCENFFKEAEKIKILYTSRIDSPAQSNCDKFIIVNEKLYNSSKASNILKAEIKENCLFLTFSLLTTQDRIADVDLIDSGQILESFPIQRNIKLVIKESLTKPTEKPETTSFDLSKLAEIGEEIIFNLEGYDKQIRYKRVPQCGDPNVKCGNQEQVKELQNLKRQLEEIISLAESVTCENPSDWKITPIGSKACGGPQSFLAYSIKIDETAFLKKVEDYKIAEDNYNKKWSIASDCALAIKPTIIECKDGKAILK